MGLARTLAVSSSVLASQLRGWRGTAAYRPAAKQPERLLELYEYEGCPYCRLVRETLTELDLDAQVYPCPKGGTRFRPKAKELGGKRQFPYLVDPNTGAKLYESADIIAYLRKTYAGREGRPGLLDRPIKVATSMLASGLRPARGLRARPSKAPGKPLELFSFESSPFSRLVREVLCELELPYLLHSVAKGSPRRSACRERSGTLQVPYLHDPNTGRSLFESADIVAYLEATYAQRG